MSIIQSKASAYWDFRSGSLDDQIGSLNGTFSSAPYFSYDGLHFDGVDDFVDIGDTSLTIKSVVVLMEPKTTTEDVCDFDAATHTLEFSGGTLTATGFATPTLYVDGLAGSTVTTQSKMVGATTATGFAADNFDIGTETIFFEGVIKAVVISTSELTATEMAQMHGELAGMVWSSKPKGKAKAEASAGNTNYNKLTDGDMEASGTSSWAAGNNAVLTKNTSNPRVGSQALRITYGGTAIPRATQNAALNTLGIIRLTGYMRGDGTAAPSINTPGGTARVTGTNSTDWQWFDTSFETSDVNIFLRAGAVGAGQYCEFDNVLIQQLGKTYYDVQFKTDYGATESVANVTGGFLENTPFENTTGTHKVVTDTFNGRSVKAISAITGGTLTLTGEVFSDSDWEMYINTGSGYALDITPPIASNVITTTTGHKYILSDVNGDYSIIKYS